MKRRLIQQGLGGQTISLPIKWVRTQKLTTGDEVEVSIHGKDLLISGEGKPPLLIQEVTLFYTEQKYLRTIIASLYKQGYDEIVLRFPETPPLATLQTIVSNFTGLEIIEYHAKRVHLKSFLHSNNNETAALIKKMFLLIKFMFSSITNQETTQLQELSKQSIRLRDHCLRDIHSLHYGDGKAYDYYDCVTQLQKIASDLAHLGNYLVITPFLLEHILFKKLVSQFDALYHSYLQKDQKALHALWVTQSNLLKSLKKNNLASLQKICQEEDPCFIVFYFHLMERYLHLSSRLLSLHIM